MDAGCPRAPGCLVKSRRHLDDGRSWDAGTHRVKETTLGCRLMVGGLGASCNINDTCMSDRLKNSCHRDDATSDVKEPWSSKCRWGSGEASATGWALNAGVRVRSSEVSAFGREGEEVVSMCILIPCTAMNPTRLCSHVEEKEWRMKSVKVEEVEVVSRWSVFVQSRFTLASLA